MPPTIVSTAVSSAPAGAVIGTAAVRPFPLAWVGAVLLASFAVLAWLMERAELNIDPFAPATICFTLAFATAAALRYAFRIPATSRERVTRDMAEFFGLVTAFGLIGAVASYPIAAATHGYVDAGLQRADELLQFHWLAWYHLVSAHRSLQLLGTVAYQSIFISPVVLMGHFARRGHAISAYRFIVALWITEVLILALFSFMPAVGPLAYLAANHVSYLPDSELYMADLIPALRQHSVHIVDLGAIRGLVSAPSFHTASAVLFITAAWPHRSLRVPLTALNAAMLLATPIEGTHYLTDMILGAAVAGVAIGLTGRLFAWRQRAVANQAGSTAIKVTP